MLQPWETCREKAIQLCSAANRQTEFGFRTEYEALAFLYMDPAELLAGQEHAR